MRRNRSFQLVRALAEANPVAESLLESDALASALDRVGERIVAEHRRRTRKRPRRLAVAVAFVAVALVAAAVAVGAMLTTHTGFFPAVAGTENDASEFLRTDAPDFPPLVARLVDDIPFPPGDSAAAHVQQYVRQVQAGPDGVPMTVQAAGINGWFGSRALCEWRGYWLQAHADGDAAKAALAADGLLRVASSDAVKKSDSWWPKYVALGQSEVRGDAAAPPELESWYRVNCANLPKPWAGK